MARLLSLGRLLLSALSYFPDKRTLISVSHICCPLGVCLYVRVFPARRFPLAKHLCKLKCDMARCLLRPMLWLPDAMAIASESMWLIGGHDSSMNHSYPCGWGGWAGNQGFVAGTTIDRNADLVPSLIAQFGWPHSAENSTRPLAHNQRRSRSNLDSALLMCALIAPGVRGPSAPPTAGALA